MREQKFTRTIEEINGYIADDGTWFRNKSDCIAYEESVKMVAFNMVKEKMIVKSSIYGLLEEGSEEDDVEIYNVDSLNTVELLNRYIYLYTYDKKADLIKTDMIGKQIIICWNYDRDCCWCKGTIDDLLNNIKERYNRLINKTEN